MRRALSVGLSLAALAAIAAGGALYGVPEWLISALERLYPGCLYRVHSRQPLIGLTIDDGPDSASTPAILAQLHRHDARATFFLIAERVKGQERLVRALATAGHELGNHFTRDRPSLGLSLDEFEADLVETHRVLARYAPVVWARPGSGWYSRPMVDVMHRHRYRCALGSVYPYDAAIPSAGFAAGYILRNARPGAVIVLHDGGGRGERTAEALREVLPELRRRGYRVVTLSELAATGGSLR